MTLPAAPRFDRESEAQRRFEAAARAAGIDPDDRWVGGYAAYEWDHLRLALDAYGIAAEGCDALEFGCNVGGSSVVLAALGARLSAADIDADLIPVAQANLDRHGLTGDVRHIGSDGRLPFADASFDLAIANSVLEYVAPEALERTVGELHRVLRPGGQLFICGTASRLALLERHSRRWFVNLLPRGIDRLTGRTLQRGLSPSLLARCLRGRFAIDGNAAQWVAARRAIHGQTSLAAQLLARLGRATGAGPGWIAPYIELLLRKA
jgi:SAM-dependent methyltransferase